MAKPPGGGFGIFRQCDAQMLDGRAADRERLQALNDEMTATGMPIEGAKVSVESLGRSPLLMAILVVLGSGFFLLILVFVRQGLKGASQDPRPEKRLNASATASCCAETGRMVAIWTMDGGSVGQEPCRTIDWRARGDRTSPTLSHILKQTRA